MDDLTQLLRVTPATEIAKKWNVTEARLDELVNTYKLPLYAIREKRIRPTDSQTVYFCSGPHFKFYYEGDYGHGAYVLEGEYFNTDNVEMFEVEHPEILWGVAPEEGESEYIPAEDVRKQLGMSPIQFVDMLNGQKGPRLVTSWEEWHRANNWFETDQLKELAIHRSDLAEYLRERAHQVESVPSTTPDGVVDFSAVLKPSYADLESQLAEAQTQNESLRQWNRRLNEQNQGLRTELAELKIQSNAAATAISRRDNSAATIGKLRKDLQRWKAALPLAVTATARLLATEVTEKTRPALLSFICEVCVSKCDAPKIPCAVFSREQFEAWRAAVPPEHVDNQDKSEKEDSSAYPLNTVEAIEGEGNIEN